MGPTEGSPSLSYRGWPPFEERWKDEVLIKALRGHTGKLAASDVWNIIDKPTFRRDQADCIRLGRIMRELGWQRTMRRFDGQLRSAYVRGTGTERLAALYAVKCPITGDFMIIDSTSPTLDGLW
jgi:hypothetical protein